MRRWLPLFLVAGVIGAGQGLLWSFWLGADGMLPAFVTGLILGSILVLRWPPRYGSTK